MKAVILAGGKGTRLRPYSMFIPKPLVPVGDRPILEILIKRLRECGVHEVLMCVNHLAEVIMSYFGDGSKFNIRMEYSLEDMPLSTVAPTKLLKGLPENFLVVNGDLLTDLDFSDLYRYHLEKKGLLTVAVHKRKVNIDFGVVEVDEQKMVAVGFKEKPDYDLNASMGVYVFNRKLLDYIPGGEPYGFDDLMSFLLEKQQPVHIYQYSGYWMDIGRPDDYEKAIEDIEHLRL
jgi:NDP-sugar pyrophosphorylase family protein